MKILITGANGMLGRALQRQLQNHTVVQHTRDHSNLANPIEYQNFYRLILGGDFDYVIHTAALVGGLEYNNKYPYDFAIINNIINNLVVKACVDSEVPRFLAILSVCCYGDGFPESDYPLTEDKFYTREPHPTNAPYAYSKRQLAQLIDAVNKQYDKNYTYLTPCNLYGEEDSRGEHAHFCSIMVDKIIAHEKLDNIYFQGDGEAKRQYLFIEDFAKIIKIHLENDVKICYNVASDEELSAREMAQALLDKIGSRAVLNFRNTMVQGQSKRTVSNARFKTIHPDFKFTSFADGIEKVYNKWYK